MIKKFIKCYYYIVFIGLSFYFLDLYLRFINLKVNFGSLYSKTANLFTLSWIAFFIFLLIFFKGKKRKIIYIGLLVLFNIFFLTNYIYHGVFGTFFSVKAIGLAEEGYTYFSVIFSYISVPLIIIFILVILCAFLACKYMPKEHTKEDLKVSLSFLSLAIVFYVLARVFLGAPAQEHTWNVWEYKWNVYQDFTDTEKCLQTAGFYEYTVRDMYTSTIKHFFNKNKKDKVYLDKYFKEKEINIEKNEWTNKFKNKNVIIVLMESIDSWLITEQTMPHLYQLMHQSINFTNHFAPLYIGGATFNSEFMINTGYMTPLNEELAANTYAQNVFRESLPQLFVNAGYNANAFHMNYGSFYNRTQMARAYGYNHYYGSLELGIPIKTAYKDTHFLTNDKLSKLVIPDNGEFLSYITTYSAHVTYEPTSLECSIELNSEDKASIKKGADEREICIKAQARETDNFFKLLIKKLKDKNKLDDTVIIGLTDHPAYGYADTDKLMSLKKSKNDDFVSNVPFFIWSNDMKQKEVTKVNSNIDILPTIANLFGLNFDSRYYLSQDIFNNSYKGFVFFPDFGWYDGDTYYKNGKVQSGINPKASYIDDRNKQISDILKVNKAILTTDYFSQKKFKK